jgi:hypothetical protein
MWKNFQAWNGDKNRVIRADLDYLDALPPAQSDSPGALNSTYVQDLRENPWENVVCPMQSNVTMHKTSNPLFEVLANTKTQESPHHEVT